MALSSQALGKSPLPTRDMQSAFKFSLLKPCSSRRSLAQAPFTPVVQCQGLARPIKASSVKRFQPIKAQASVNAASASQQQIPDAAVSIVLLAGGVGKRMGAAIPKQYLDLKGQPIATYSLETFAKMREVGEIVIVCGADWRNIFEARSGNIPKHVSVQRLFSP